MDIRTSLITASLWLVAFLAPIHTFMIAVGVLITFDLISGIWRAIKKGERVTSKGFRRTITKMVAYQAAVITAFLLESVFIGDLIPVVRIVSGFIAITECKSIYENLSIISGLDFWTLIKEQLNSQSDKYGIRGVIDEKVDDSKKIE